DWPADTQRAYPSLSIPGGAACRVFPKGTAGKGPVQMRRLSTPDQAIDLLAQTAQQGAACLWVRNAVDEAIAAVQALRDRGIAASLLHARFALCDRKRIELAELGRFGPDGQGRTGRVLIATQVVESSLDLDFDVMVSDLAPMAALVQRAGRLWRHMAQRPAAARPVAAPVLHVLSPDPAQVKDAHWLKDLLGAGAWIYPIADQWRTAARLFDQGRITAPEGLRDLIEAVHDDAVPVPPALDAAERERTGEGYARANQADQNAIVWENGYRDGASGAEDISYPTRLGPESATLVLARRQDGGLAPWAAGEVDSRQLSELWMLSEVSADKRKMARLPMPDQSAPEILAITKGWSEWRTGSVTLCPVGTDGSICEGLRYDAQLGLLFAPSS
ncbi:MAG: CRISPR-associated helicase/endonuclease Cas3, partial [Rhodobacteraceae bacterium]|nr:CRISPR-associated helicase/endonuclease Cas3 [Paracoccaceae bacterium]